MPIFVTRPLIVTEGRSNHCGGSNRLADIRHIIADSCHAPATIAVSGFLWILSNYNRRSFGLTAVVRRIQERHRRSRVHRRDSPRVFGRCRRYAHQTWRCNNSRYLWLLEIYKCAKNSGLFSAFGVFSSYNLSFGSKLLATVDDSAVIFDRNVASYFGEGGRLID